MNQNLKISCAKTGTRTKSNPVSNALEKYEEINNSLEKQKKVPVTTMCYLQGCNKVNSNFKITHQNHYTMKRTFTMMFLAITSLFFLPIYDAFAAVPESHQPTATPSLDVNILLPDQIVLSHNQPLYATIENQNTESVNFDAMLEIEDAHGNIVFMSARPGNLVEANTVEIISFDQWITQIGDYQARLLLQYNSDAATLRYTKDFSVVSNRTVLKPLYEIFTSSTCGPCAYANPIVDAVLEANAGNHSIIKYQMNWPGQGDPYYHPDGGMRSQYYSVSGVPHLRINAESVVPSQLNQQIYDSFLGEASDMEIQITNAYIDLSGNLEFEATISVAENMPEGLTLHAAVLEKVTTQNVASNGEKEFHHVMMKMFPNGNGSLLPALTPGAPHSFSFDYDMNQTFMEKPNRLEIIIFVQDDQTKAVIQSQMADVEHNFEDYALTFEVKDNLGNLVVDAYIFVEEYGSKYTNDHGMAYYDGVLPGIYDYEITASGLYSTEGTVEISSNDVLVEIELESPEFYFYEDFYEGIPNTWTIHVTSPDFLYSTGEKVIFFRQGSAGNPIILVAPEIDFTPVEMLYFDAGEIQGAVSLILGTMSDPVDPTTFAELENYTLTTAMQTFSFDISQLENPEGIRLAWKHQGGVMTYFSFDNVIITATELQTYNLFLDADPQIAGMVEGNGEYLPGEEITLIATPNDEWAFVEWTDFEGTFVSNEAEFLFTMPEADVILIAHFESTVGISTFEQAPVLVYPNPAGERFYVSANDDIIQQIIITDPTGKVVYRQQHDQKHVIIPTDSFRVGGIYFLEIRTAKESTVRKLRVSK